VKAVREEEGELQGIGFVKQAGFKMRVKESGELWMSKVTGETEEEEVMGERIGESEVEKLVPE